jgi:hypothetical protein
MNDGASKLQYPSEFSSYGVAWTLEPFVRECMTECITIVHHHLGDPNVARGAPKAKVVEDRGVIRIRTDANHSGQGLVVKLKLHYTFWARFRAVLVACRSEDIDPDR